MKPERIKQLAQIYKCEKTRIETVIAELSDHINLDQIDEMVVTVMDLVRDGIELPQAIKTAIANRRSHQVTEGVQGISTGLSDLGDKSIAKARQMGELMGVKMKAVTLTTAAQVVSGAVEPQDPDIKSLNDQLETAFFGELDITKESLNPLKFLNEMRSNPIQRQLKSAGNLVEVSAEPLT